MTNFYFFLKKITKRCEKSLSKKKKKIKHENDYVYNIELSICPFLSFNER